MCKKTNLTIIFFGAVLLIFAADAKSGMVAHWDFEEGSGSVAQDISGNNHNGVLIGNTAWTAGAPTGDSPAGGLYFDGQGDYVDCTNNPAFDIANAITVGAWVNITLPSPHGLGWDRIVTKGDDRAYGLLRYDGVGGAFFYVHHPDGTQSEAYGTIDITGGWHHIAGVYDGQNIFLYVDGQLDPLGPLSKSYAKPIATDSAHVLIGYASPSVHCAYFNGLIDDVRIYTDAQCAQQIVTWAGNTPIPTPGAILLGSIGLGVVGWFRRRNKTQ